MNNKKIELKKHEISSRLCPIHKCNLWSFHHPIPGTQKKKREEFCPECVRENIKQDEAKLTEENLNSQLYQTTYFVFERDSIIPPELKEVSFENFLADTVEEKKLLQFTKQQVQKYLNGMAGNTIITGETGIGKSHLSIAMAKALNEGFKEKGHPKSVLFISLTEIIKRIKEGWNYGKGAKLTENEAKKRLVSADFLIIDDLGAKNAVINAKSDWEQDFLFDILNNREITIINTNLSATELKTVYNIRNSSRILKGAEGNTFKAFGIKDKRYSIQKLKERRQDMK